MKTTEIVKVDPGEYGLDEKRADQIATAFLPTVDKMKEFIPEFERLDGEEMSEEKCRDAKALRLKFVKVRTGTAAIHKEQKADYLRAGKYCDAWKNAQLEVSTAYEDKLKAWEEYYDRIEQAKIEALQAERSALLAETDMPPTEGLGVMAEDVWNNLYAGAVAAKKARVDAEEKAEADRIKAEAAAKVEAERIRAENERLKQEQEEAARKEAERKAEQDKKDAAIEAERQKEREEAEAKRQAERAEEEAKLKAEREAKEKVEAELRAKREAEEEAARQAERAAQAELQKGDAQKMADLCNDLLLLKTKYTFESETFHDAYTRAGDFIDILIGKLTDAQEKAA
jgi:hypothetical protein